ncbi:NAD(P)H dehydrogenase (quinone) [Entomortierella parvispora]|uniref:NAD(P)H dehydrogenase (Quinone) n=1 Tax=Entomortierella parvispora TaxID=205924 RepID=A0A9P3H4E0_9FUNG|nr:NAD(P)H dehydrogenase (quinone) [Entomortierella parvispora]
MTASKILVVFGSTGNQGGSVVEHVLKDPVLSKEYKIRAVTRDTSKPAAQELTKLGDVEVVQGDLTDAASIKSVLEGAHTVFVATATVYGERLEEIEKLQGKNAADAAVAAGASYIIYSSQPNVAKVSGGKYTRCGHFDAKNDVEQYIRGLPIRSAFFGPGTFMQNFANHTGPKPAGDGTYFLASIAVPTAEFPLINIQDTGKWVGAILANPDAFEGKFVPAASEVLTWEEIAQAISKATGKTVVYKQIPESVLEARMPPGSAPLLVDMFFYFQDFGYYGPETRKVVAEGVASARGKPATFAEFLEQTNYTLA